MFCKKAGDVTLEVACGDITSQKDIDAIVNAANAKLAPGGGVAGAIHRKAGPGLFEECKSLAPIKTGQAVITGAYNLPNKHVIHTLGPVYGRDKPEEQLLGDCYRNSLRIADENNVESIAFPAISTGIFGYPIEEAAKESINTVAVTIQELKNIKLIRFVLFNESDLEVYKKVLERF